MTPACIDLSELGAEVREQLGLPAQRAGSRRNARVSMDEIRGLALRILGGELARYTPAVRARVLRHALKVNAV